MDDIQRKKHRKDDESPGDIIILDPVGHFAAYFKERKEPEGRNIRKTVRGAECRRTDGDPVNDRPETESCHRKIMALKPEHRSPNDVCDDYGCKYRHYAGGPGLDGQELAAVEVRPLREQAGLRKEDDNAAVFQRREVMRRQKG